ncbi:MAG: hypothetical protein MJ185_02870 [Treponema sp.]|nr:hypothetical protein [Treponema sp.]
MAEEIKPLDTLEAPELSISQDSHSYEHTPNSVPIDLMQRALANSGNLELMEQRQAEISKRNGKLEVINANDGSIKIRQETDDYSTVLTFFFQSTKKLPQPAKKILRFVMTKVSEQAFSNRELYSDKIKFQLKDIVDAGIYTNIESARTGFKAGSKALVNMAIEGELKKGKGAKQEKYMWSYGHIFRKASIINGVCQIDLETDNDWNFIIPNYEITPRYIYQLANRSFDLAEAIFYYARVNCRQIADEGYFTLSLKVIQQRLALPDETPNPKRDIQKPILDSIQEINDRETKTQNFKIEVEGDNDLPIKGWIETGRIKITFYNDYLEQYKRYSHARAAKIEEAASANKA